MSEEWGPWIEHDGKGCPVPVGTFVHTQLDCLPDVFCFAGLASFAPGSNIQRPRCAFKKINCRWDWGSGASAKIIRYRVRKPRGLTILEGLLEDLPEEVDA